MCPPFRLALVCTLLAPILALVRSLKALRRDVEEVRYPRPTHEMSRAGEPKQRLDSLGHYEEFFRRYVGEN